jgi:hypothetical protein
LVGEERWRPECECTGWGDIVRADNSAALKRGEDSRGRHHCTAFRRNNSDQDSSRSITYVSFSQIRGIYIHNVLN